MIDLHCHLCFGCDDGPKTKEDAQDLARALLDVGVTEVACTPHVRPDKGWMNARERQAALHARLDEALAEAGLSLPHHHGAEHYFDADVLDEAFAARMVPYGTSRWLLVELPYHGPPTDLLGPLFRLRGRGARVLLAHVERYPYVADRDDVLEQIVNAGHLVQVNLGSLAGAYTRAHRKAAERLVTRGYAAVAAGDCHRAKDAADYITKGRKALAKLVGEEGVRRMTETVPRGILCDDPPEALWP